MTTKTKKIDRRIANPTGAKARQARQWRQSRKCLQGRAAKLGPVPIFLDCKSMKPRILISDWVRFVIWQLASFPRGAQPRMSILTFFGHQAYRNPNYIIFQSVTRFSGPVPPLCHGIYSIVRLPRLKSRSVRKTAQKRSRSLIEIDKDKDGVGRGQS